MHFQLPQPTLKPLSSDDIAESNMPSSSGYAIQSSSSSSDTMQSKYFDQSSRRSKSSFQSNDLTLEKLPRAQETFSMEMYEKAGGRVLEGKRDLFSGLDQTVRSINFNNISSDSLSEVTIHKRNRTADDTFSQTSNDSQSTTLSDFDAPKKKKYKIVPNTFVSPPSKSESASAATTSRSPENSPNASNVAGKILPKDRKELLMFVSIYSLYCDFYWSNQSLFY